MNPSRTFNVSLDGQKFLMIKDPSRNQPSAPVSTSILVTLNCFEELKARVSAR